MNDEVWMRMAIAEGRKGLGRTAPNPAVGCVIVKDGNLLGAGWHKRAGMPHAEREAMSAVRTTHGNDALRGATAYITLEPCSTHGRTPPCVDGLCEAGITRVVYACEDPNPAHAGNGKLLLEKHGVEVLVGVGADEARMLIRGFVKTQLTGLPWVIVKTAMSLDGRITRPAGESPWLSGPESLRYVQELRSQCDMIVTSGETVRRDKPSMTIRVTELLEGREQPWRMIFTRDPDSLPMHAPIICDENKHRTLVRDGDIARALREAVREQGVTTVMVEAGGVFVAELFRLGLVDEVVFFLTPWITGGLPAVAGTDMPEIRLHDISWHRCGDDMMARALVTS